MNDFAIKQIQRDINDCEYMLDCYEARLLRAKRLAAIDAVVAEEQLTKYTRLFNEETKKLSLLKVELDMWADNTAYTVM